MLPTPTFDPEVVQLQREKKRRELDQVLKELSFRICHSCHKIEHGIQLTDDESSMTNGGGGGGGGSCHGEDHQLSELKHQWRLATCENTQGQTLYFAGHHYSIPDYISIISSNQPEAVAEQINRELIEFLEKNPFNKCVYCDILLPQKRSEMSSHLLLPPCTGPYSQYRDSKHVWRKATLSDAEREGIYTRELDSKLTIREYLRYGITMDHDHSLDSVEKNNNKDNKAQIEKNQPTSGDAPQDQVSPTVQASSIPTNRK